MKCMSFFWLVILLPLTQTLYAQTIYTIDKDISYSKANIPTTCSNCVINIGSGVTLTIDKDINLQNTTINGGKITAANKTITLWTEVTFSNTTITISKNGELVSAAELTIDKSDFNFYNSATAIIYSTVNMTESSFGMFDKSEFEATGGSFNMKSGSKLTAGGGNASSTAYIKFNGATLNEYDKSYITLGNKDNYYFNWSSYNTIDNGKSISTSKNKINCGVPGKNSCASPLVYGPSTLNMAGLSSFSTLPVILSEFNVRSVNNKILLTWTTDQESNSQYFQVEKSDDGIRWTAAGTIPAKGNSSLPTHYSYTDSSPTTGKVNYRLKMVDNDQSFEYSPVKSISTTAIHEMNIYPNPAADYVVVYPKDGVQTDIRIQLLDESGKLLKQLTAKGNKYISLTPYRTGNYLVKIWEADGSSQVFHLVIKK